MIVVNEFLVTTELSSKSLIADNLFNYSHELFMENTDFPQ